MTQASMSGTPLQRRWENNSLVGSLGMDWMWWEIFGQQYM
jgi:hypothetical protein